MAFLGVVRDAVEGLRSFFGRKQAGEGQVIAEPPELGPRGVPRHLMDRVTKAYNDMARIRREHYEGVREFVGPYSLAGDRIVTAYRTAGESPTERRLPVPLIRNYVQTYCHLLTSGTPQCNVETQHEEYRSFAEDFKTVLNRHLLEVDIGPGISGAVWSAMFSLGIVKTGLAEGEEGFEVEGEYYDAGKSFSQSVGIRNFVIDMQADSVNEIDFVGDRYLRPREWVEALRAKRRPAGGTGAGVTDATGSRLAAPHRVSGITEGQDKRLYDTVWVWDIYLPKQGLMCRFADGDDEPLDVFPWDGPEGGPYALLGFGWVDGEVLPSAPVPALRPLADLVNAATRKIERQAARAKEVYLAPRAGTDAETIMNAADGAVVGVENPEAVKPARFGGPDPALMALIPWGMAEFDKQAGNLSMLAGLAPQSETLGQDQLLREAANAQINAMRSAVIRMVTRVLYHHAWYVWTDPLRTYGAERRVPNTTLTTHLDLGPRVREGDFLQYTVTLQPYSMSQPTPAEQVEVLRRFWMQDVAPNVQLLMQSGQMVNAAGYIRRIAAMTNVPMRDEVLLEQSLEEMGRQSPDMVPEPPEVAQARAGRPGGGVRDHNQDFMRAIGAMAADNRSG